MTKSDRIDYHDELFTAHAARLERLGERVRDLEGRATRLEDLPATHVLADRSDAAPTHTDGTAGTVAPDTLPPIKVGDRVRVLKVPGFNDHELGIPYVGLVLNIQTDGELLVAGNPAAANPGRNQPNGVGWFLWPENVERISPLWREPEPPKCDGCDSLRSELAAERKAHGETKEHWAALDATYQELSHQIFRGTDGVTLATFTRHLQRYEGRIKAIAEPF